ncbi:MAG: nucleotidyltransferase domain-containing protein [Candidatus Moranbacteria bacterium]|nr:nucleotidyltransferase domain-containing protein [Candidatus Moranbacteria bacterium]
MKNLFETPIKNELSEERKRMALLAIEKIKNRLSPEELELIRTIVLFGSTAKGEATEKSDLDIYVDYEIDNSKKILGALKKITKMFDEELPDMDFSFGFGDISLKKRTAKVIVGRSSKHPDTPSQWDILYSRNEETRKKIDSELKLLSDSHGNKDLRNFESKF